MPPNKHSTTVDKTVDTMIAVTCTRLHVDFFLISACSAFRERNVLYIFVLNIAATHIITAHVRKYVKIFHKASVAKYFFLFEFCSTCNVRQLQELSTFTLSSNKGLSSRDRGLWKTPKYSSSFLFHSLKCMTYRHLKFLPWRPFDQQPLFLTKCCAN